MVKRKKAKPGEEFFFHNGARAETKAQLVSQLKKLTPEEFISYVNEQKNDVYNWLRDCIDSELAKKIKNVNDQKKMIGMLK